MKEKKLTLKSNKKVAIVYRLHSPAAVKMSKKLAARLKSKRFKVFTAPEQKQIAGTELLVSSNDLKEMSLVIVLGGDGTYLRAVRLLKGHSVPILGFNMGFLGFLTAHSIDSVFEIVDDTIKGKMILRTRSRLHLTVKFKSGKRVSYNALNDVVIERGSFSQLISTALYFDKSLVNHIKADGIIISSPTGSTAYNLAAGGPILHPEVHAIVVTPVAPHSLTTRPLIFPDNKRLVLSLDKNASQAYLIVDGQKVLELSSEDEVTITRDKVDHYMIRREGHNFFDLLKEKLKFGDRYVTGT
ncbi:NAD(+)/NADH kinase [Pseudobdellovibrio exovorus]|uniref:NAD kinase n=1 Tax=Pseudobdellovibrio exovorus JSS TaxID=1184267 RepID=M4VAG5_9BACT|nr:NAD(+)/NADH kinase [Pseudobdellovibrio exovorus]AGH96218.1 inorganic polyphosphate/ATP-NAD kinase [Pseudobdellovibrio exovorus JSS]